jgi:hypothetical protein
MSSIEDAGLVGRSGRFACVARPRTAHRFYQRGFWRMSPGRRSLVHADGTAALLVADTAWALPWRATEEQCRVYAADRQAKGFNAALLMSVQPDMHARGPRDRTTDEGFAVGFDDLARGHLNALTPAYVQYLDRLITILVEHEIVPVLQPVFQGFGWKGLSVAGTVAPPAEYARYCRYLVARYGARPAMYLVGADGSGEEPQASAGGEERVADMWRNTPAKGVANDEPTYEQTGRVGKATGWWQGHEAWCNLCAGGAMGVVYGAASLWQWWLHRDEHGHALYFLAAGAGWISRGRATSRRPHRTYSGRTPAGGYSAELAGNLGAARAADAGYAVYRLHGRGRSPDDVR